MLCVNVNVLPIFNSMFLSYFKNFNIKFDAMLQCILVFLILLNLMTRKSSNTAKRSVVPSVNSIDFQRCCHQNIVGLAVYNDQKYKMYDSKDISNGLAKCTKMYQGFAKCKEPMILQIFTLNVLSL